MQLVSSTHHHSTLARFILLFAFLYAAFGVNSPFFPSFLSARGLEPEAIAVVLAAGTAIRLVAAPLAGRIADRLDASRAVLAASIAGAAGLDTFGRPPRLVPVVLPLLARAARLHWAYDSRVM